MGTLKILLCGAMLAAACAARAQSPDGRFPVFFRNGTFGEYTDDSIFIYGLGIDAAGRWCRFLPDGTMRPIDPADAKAPDHLTRRGVAYANYAFPLSRAGDFKLPAYVKGGRLYLSLGAPLCFPIGDNAWGGPDLMNPSDPNAEVIFDWYELSYVHGGVPFGGNTTQVDQFGFPLVARLRQETGNFDETVGTALSREEVFSRYQSSVGTAFQSLAGPSRIVAPRSSTVFKPGGAGENLLRDQIDAAWAYYAAHPFRLARLGVTFSGLVMGNADVTSQRLRFTRSPAGADGAGPFFIDKPTTADVFACSGALARAGMKTTELELGAELCAALNRGVALRTQDWYSPSAYYVDPARNDYAMFFHGIGIDKRAYGFAYDDVNDQSSVKILPNADPPTSLTLTVGPIRAGVSVLPAAKPARGPAAAELFFLDGKIASRRSRGKVFERPLPAFTQAR
jgi:hypothetical protein